MKFDPTLLTLLSILATLGGILVAVTRGFTELKEGLGFTTQRVDRHEERIDGHEVRIKDLEVGHARLERVRG